LTWEEAVRWYRSQPDNAAAVRDNYFDLPVKQAAERFSQSEEFAEVLRLLGNGGGQSILDLGAGNGIASYALAKNGWSVTATEPDPSSEVGAGAIRLLAAEAGLPIEIVEKAGESLPFPGELFAAIHARQVLHHAANLGAMVLEMSRVLRAGGLILVTREHVVDNEEQLAEFRATHPLHHLYGGENAYSLEEYTAAFTRARLEVVEVWGPAQSILNYFPKTEAERQRDIRQIAKRSWGRFGRLFVWSEAFRARQVRLATLRDQTPGRCFSFLLKKP